MKNEENRVDLSCYVALGDSISAGYTDAALYYEGQIRSFTNLLAAQFAEAGGGKFRQPLMPQSSVGIGFNGNARIIQSSEDGKEMDLTFMAETGDLGVFSSNIYAEKGPFNNLGIPAAKSYSLVLPGYGNPENGPGNFNPYFTRVASEPRTASIISDALKLNPSFFTLLIGNNDVLIYAVKGGTTDVITPLSHFKKSLSEILHPFVSSRIKGAIATLPDILSIPYFTCIPHNGLRLTFSEAKNLNEKYAGKGVKFFEGPSSYLVCDPSFSSGVRQLKEDELMLYDIVFDPLKEKYLKAELPVPEKYYLSSLQVWEIRKAILQFNNEIKGAAREEKLALVDLHRFLMQTKPDRSINPKSLKVQINTAGIFSLDGLHINALGQALLANEFIKSINANYGSDISQINLMRFRDTTNLAVNR